VSGLALTAYGGNLFRQGDLTSIDYRFEIRGETKPPANIVVVEIDDVTFDDLDRQWPFPRSLHGRVIDRLREAGAKTIVFDVQFTEPTRPREDNALLDAVFNAGNVVLATTEVDDQGRTNVFGGDDVLREIGARAGNALLPPEPGGVIRRVPFSTDKLESLPVVATEAFTGREVDSSDFGGVPAFIDYHGPPGTFPSISYSQVLHGRFGPDLFRDKLVLIGPAAPSLQDVHPTPYTDDLMAGAEVQANATSTVLRGLPLRDSPRWLDAALIAALGMLVPIAALRLSLPYSIALSLAAAGGYIVATQVAFNQGVVLSFIYPFGSLVLSAIGTLGAYYVLAIFERERVRDAFSRFVPEAVVDEVLSRAGGVRLGGMEREGTVMFTDLRGFTSFAEGRPAEQVIDVLNRYLDGMSDAILSNGGTLVAYMGDGIMAVFGAPIEQADHADRAVATARDMLCERLPRVNAWLRDENMGARFRMGIGLNTGRFMSGNVGSERRLEYTAIGDATNTASRLEGMTKESEYSLFIADSTRAALQHGVEDLVYVDEFPVRGRQTRVKIWSLEAARKAADEPVERAPQEELTAG